MSCFVVNRFFCCINLHAACCLIGCIYLLEAAIQCTGFTKVHLACWMAGYSRRGGYTFSSSNILELGHHWNIFSLSILLYNILLNILLIFGGLCANTCLCILWLNAFSVVCLYWELELFFCFLGSEFCKCTVHGSPSSLFINILLIVFFIVLGFFLYFTLVVYSYVHHLQHYWFNYQKENFFSYLRNTDSIDFFPSRGRRSYNV